MDVRKSPRSLKNTSTASPSSAGLKLTSTASPSSTPNHSKQTHNLISTSFIPPKLKSTPASTTTAEKSHVVGAESPKKKNHGRLWTDKDEILLLTNMADYVKRGENPNSVAFCEFIQPKISVNVDFGQIRSKIRHTRDAYLEKEKEEKKGIVLKFKSPHHQECHELSKPIWGSGGEGSETAGVENEDDVEIRKSKIGKKRKAGSMRQTKDGNATGANEQLEEVGVVAEKLKAATVEKRQHRKDGAEGSEAADQANKKKQGEKVGDKKHGKAGAGDVEAKADGQGGKHGEKERSKKKKKKKMRTEVGNADNVLEKLKPTADKQQECLCQLMTHQGKEQLTKAPFDLESSLNEKTLQLIEPSKVMAYQQKWKEMRITEMELFLKKNDLVREGSLLVLEALKAPPS